VAESQKVEQVLIGISYLSIEVNSRTTQLNRRITMELTNDDLQKVTAIMWSKKYAVPVFLVDGKKYVGSTGEFAGYYEEVATDEVGE
jgi:hypothetical protein